MKAKPTAKSIKIQRNHKSSAIKLFYKLFILTVCLGGVLIFQSCKEPNGIGLEVQPQSEKFNTSTETSNNFISFSVKEVAQRSDETSQNMLGSYNDPVFGTAKTGFLAQFILSQNTPNFGESPSVDSVVLSLPYLGYYGSYAGVENKQRFQIYQVSRQLYRDSIYYSNINTAYYTFPALLADTVIQPNPTAPITIEGNTLAAQLRIKLSKTLGENIINPTNKQYLNSSGEFLNFLQGLYVTVNNTGQAAGSGAIYNFDLLNSESKLTIYFKNTGGTGSFSLIVTSDCVRIGVFETNYSNAIDITNQITEANKGQNQFYLQSMGGLKGKIELPILKTLKNVAPLAINQAEIVFKVKEGTDSKYTVPSRLYLTRINTDGSSAFLSDQSEGDNYYGGIYNAATKEYTFNVARYFQQVISEKYQDNGLYLLVGGSAVTANRVVLNGGDQIKIKLTYTKI